ncbi:MAG: hypothetical protein K0R14_1850 [Burkholderiales bacterium]|jgi:serine/threonine-protein kinase HipA|nr:hypothetical protein [Burkholderiales bacterium]
MLDVYVENEIIGNLFRSELDRSKIYFGYKQEAIAKNAVSLSMPVCKEQYISEYNNLHPIFDMNLPEGALRERLRKEFSKVVPQFDDLTLLGITGKSGIGRLRFTLPGEKLTNIPTQNIRELITHDGAEGLFESLLDRYAVYSGISGAQPKVMVREEVPVDNIIHSKTKSIDRVTYRGATHIIKAWNKDEYPELAANEYFCMRAAKHAGLAVPEFELSKNGKFFIMKRFDLKNGTYLGFEDFCVLNGKTSGQKYEGSYESITRRIKDFVSAGEVQPALISFFKILVLSCVIKNGDAHLKNFGVLYEDTESNVSFSPAYDLVSTTPYYREDILALTLYGTKRWPNAQTLINFARLHCDMTEGLAKELMTEVVKGIIIAMKELNHYIGKNKTFEKIGTIMLEQWKQGMKLSCS